MTPLMTTPDVLVQTRCVNCDIGFAVPERWLANRRKTGETMWCPNGHQLSYAETEEDRLRKHLEAEQRRVIQANAARAAAERERQAAERSASAFKGQATRLRKRIGNGVCPCCNRHFSNVERHISNKHPEFADTEVTSS